MLAANLMIKSTWTTDHAPVPDSGKPALKFVAKYVLLPHPPGAGGSTPPYRSLEIVDFTDGGFAFPWMQFVRITAIGWENSVLNNLDVYLCKALRDDPDAFIGVGI